jgi:hypothetical protein
MEPSGVFALVAAVLEAVKPLLPLINLSTKRKATAKINKMFTMESSFFMMSLVNVLKL